MAKSHRPDRTARRTTLVPLTCAIGLGLVMLDNNALAVSLPTISEDIGVDETAARWLFVTFMLANLTLLPSVGTIAARLGRRRTYQLGLVLFGVGSVLSLLAQSFWPLLLARISQGAGGAMMVPNSAALLDANVPAPRRIRAVAAWVTFSSAGIFVGPVVGGFLTEAVSWRLIFLVELLLCTVGVVLAVRLTDITATKHRIDLAGMITGGGAVCLAAMGILEAGRPSPDWVLAGTAFGLAVPTFMIFLAVQRRVQFPALDLGVFAQPRFGALILACTIYNATVAGGQYVVSLSLQTHEGASASVAGWVVFTAMALLPIGSQVTGRLAGRFSPQRVMFWAALWLITAYVLIGLIGVDRPPLSVAPLLAVGFAVGVLFAGETARVMDMVDAKALASALSTLSLARQLGSILGIALIGSLYQQVAGVGGWPALGPLQGTLLAGALLLLPASWLLRGNLVAAERLARLQVATNASAAQLPRDHAGNERLTRDQDRSHLPE